MKYLYVLLFLSFMLRANAQTATNTFRHNSDNIYYQSLSNYLNFLKENKAIVPDTIYVEDDLKLGTDSILTKINATTIIVLKWDEVERIIKTEKSHFSLQDLSSQIF